MVTKKQFGFISIGIMTSILLTGCMTPMDAAKGVSMAKDAGLKNVATRLYKRNKEHTCNWTPIGIVNAEMGGNPTEYKAYKQYCGHSIGE